MARYVDTDKFENWDCKDINCDCIGNCPYADPYAIDEFYDCHRCFLENCKPEDVEPILHAKWWSKHGWLDKWGQCGICDYITTDKSSMNYCPNCGAKMDKE